MKAIHKNIATHNRRRNKPKVIDRPFARPARPGPPWGRMVAEFGMLVGWIALWCMNGAATAFGLAAVGAFLRERGQASLGRTDWLVIGAVVHILISAIEQHIWRTTTYERPTAAGARVKAFFVQADRLRLTLAVLVGAADSFSTAYYARRILYALVDTPLWGWNIVVAVLAGAIALSAEPMIKNFAGKLRQITREGRL